jgi:spermidine/putrescine transport system permease protein|nr:ABC transporter permease [Rhodospirillales bacterium]
MNNQSTRFTIFVCIIAVPVVLVIIPIANFFLMSFWKMESNQIVESVSFGNYLYFFSSPAYWGTFLSTLYLCLKVSAIGVLVGYPVAYFVWKRKGRIKYLLILLLILPLFMSYIVKIYTMRTILDLSGILNKLLVAFHILEEPSRQFIYNQTAILITMAVIFLPFVILPIFLSLERIPKNLVTASSDLGAGTLTTLRYVILPLSLPGTVSGALFTFVLALGDFVTPQMVGGPNGFTFGRVIWSQFGLAYNWPLGAALAVILFATALMTIIAAGWASQQRKV